MHWLKEIRLKTGLTQHQMGALLEISPSSVAMIESGRRTLPRDKALKLYQLEEKLDTQSPAVTNADQSHSDRKQKRNRQLLNNIRKFSQQQVLLSKKHEELTAKYSTHKQHFNVASQFAAQSSTATDDIETIIFNLLHRQKKTSMQRYDEVDLALHELQIDLCRFKAERLKEIADRFDIK